MFYRRMDNPRTLYLELLKKTLTNSIYGDPYLPVGMTAQTSASPGNALRNCLRKAALSLLDKTPYAIVRKNMSTPQERTEGRNWPSAAHTMIGIKRLNNIQACVERVLSEGIPGDLIEAGTWRGGATIFMRGMLKAHGVEDRLVWVADSFAGLPPPDPRYPVDSGINLHAFPYLQVSLEQVQANFQAYGLLDEQVRFLKGFFSETLPGAPIQRLALIRFDGDMYGSAMDVLKNLYHKLSPGGCMIIDDYGSIPACKQAVDDFRAQKGIRDEIKTVDWSGVFWRKSA